MIPAVRISGGSYYLGRSVLPMSPVYTLPHDGGMAKESRSRHLKTPLEQQAHDIKTAGEEGLLGKSDIEIGAAA